MGVLKLMDFIKAKFPKAIQKKTVKDYGGKILTIDASNWIYQFLIKTQSMNTLIKPLKEETLTLLQIGKVIKQVIS